MSDGYPLLFLFGTRISLFTPNFYNSNNSKKLEQSPPWQWFRIIIRTRENIIMFRELLIDGCHDEIDHHRSPPITNLGLGQRKTFEKIVLDSDNNVTYEYEFQLKVTYFSPLETILMNFYRSNRLKVMTQEYMKCQSMATIQIKQWRIFHRLNYLKTKFLVSI